MLGGCGAGDGRPSARGAGGQDGERYGRDEDPVLSRPSVARDLYRGPDGGSAALRDQRGRGNLLENFVRLEHVPRPWPVEQVRTSTPRIQLQPAVGNSGSRRPYLFNLPRLREMDPKMDPPPPMVQPGLHLASQ